MEEVQSVYLIDRLENLGRRVAGLGDGFRRVAEFLATTDLASLAAGRHVLDGDAAFVNCDATRYVRPSERRLELHRRYFDIHVPVTHDEQLVLAPVAADFDLPSFDAERDIGFVDSAEGAVTRVVRRGEFCLVWPKTCLHAPAIALGEPHDARKLVAKIRAAG